MPINAGQLRDSLLPGLREVSGSYYHTLSMWRRLFEDVEARVDAAFAVTEQSLNDNLYNLTPDGPQYTSAIVHSSISVPTDANNGEDDGLVFPHEWKGV